MAKKLVQSDDNCEGTLLIPQHHILIILSEELNGFLVGVRVDIAKVDILEALRLSNIVVVGNIDSNGRT